MASNPNLASEPWGHHHGHGFIHTGHTRHALRKGSAGSLLSGVGEAPPCRVLADTIHGWCAHSCEFLAICSGRTNPIRAVPSHQDQNPSTSGLVPSVCGRLLQREPVTVQAGSG